MKKCFKCDKEKSLSAFYKHREMKDGHLNKCIPCTKAGVRSHRADNIEKIREYDRARGKLPHRKALVRRVADNRQFSGNREKALERDFYKCRHCSRSHHDVLLNVHHIDCSGKSDSINNDMSNLLTLCDSCHAKEHWRINRAKSK